MKQEAKHFDFLQGFREHQGAKGGFNLIRDDIPEGLKRVPGIYIIETTDRFKFPYPGGKSNILYIGMSKDLDQRFRKHRSAVQKIHDDPDYGIEDFEVVNTKYQSVHGVNISMKNPMRISTFPLRKIDPMKYPKSGVHRKLIIRLSDVNLVFLKLSFRATARLKTRWPGAASRLSRQK